MEKRVFFKTETRTLRVSKTKVAQETSRTNPIDRTCAWIIDRSSDSIIDRSDAWIIDRSGALIIGRSGAWIIDFSVI